MIDGQAFTTEGMIMNVELVPMSIPEMARARQIRDHNERSAKERDAGKWHPFKRRKNNT